MKGHRLHVLVLVIVLATASSCWQGKTLSESRSAHFIIISEMTHILRDPKQTYSQRRDVWIMGGNIRVEEVMLGGKNIMIFSNNVAYSYFAGDNKGRKTAAAKIVDMSMDPLKRIENLREKGHKLGVEAIKGIVCDKYELKENSKHTVVWLSQSNNFPVKTFQQILKGTVEVASETANFENVELNSDLPKKLFQPPPDVVFEEANK